MEKTEVNVRIKKDVHKQLLQIKLDNDLGSINEAIKFLLNKQK